MTPESELSPQAVRIAIIAGGIQVAATFLAVVLLYVIVGVLSDYGPGIFSLMVLTAASLWIAVEGPANRLAVRIEAWLLTPSR